MPKTVAEVQAVVNLANEIPFKLVPSGARSEQWAVTSDGEVVLVLDRMNQIWTLPADRQVTCERVLSRAAAAVRRSQGCLPVVLLLRFKSAGWQSR